MALNIKYSPGFTGECYQQLPSGRSLVGSTAVSDGGLLEILELRLGLPSRSPEGKRRAIEYRKALDRQRKGSFYEESFSRDPLGTASTMLGWRDILLLAGWDPGKTWGQTRLKTISALERDFDSASYPGMSDRWLKVLSAVRSGNPFSAGDRIEVFRQASMLPKVIASVLELLGDTVDWSKGEVSGTALDIKDKIASGKAEILSFDEYSDALEWACTLAPETGEAIVNRDGMRLNAALRRNRLPQLSARMENGNPGIPQIFKLGLSLLMEPLNAHNLLGYLQLPVMPLPSGLARMLSRALLRDNGLGDTWEKAVGEYEKNLDDNGRKDVEKKLKKYLYSLLDARRADGQVSVDAARDFCRNICDWARGCMAEEEETAEGPFFGVLATECEDMIELLSPEGSTMDGDRFDRYVRQIYAPCSVRVDRAGLSCLPVVESTECFADTPKRIVWLSCNGELGTAWPYGFLTAAETGELNANGTAIPEKADFTRYDFARMVDCLNGADSVTLCRSAYDCGETQKEHPAVTLFKKAGAPVRAMDKKTWGGSVRKFTPIKEIAMGRDMLGGFSRTESPTSTECLASYPFDYYLENVLGLKDQRQTVLKDETLTLGLVAHRVFQELMDDCGKDIGKMQNALKAVSDVGEDPFVGRVRKAATKVGATLLLPSSSILFGSFCGTLKDSLSSLLQVLKNNRLTPFASEEGFEVDLGGELGKMKGSVDFIAENTEGDLVIIDFKYSTGAKYIQKLREDTAVQLELYSLAMENKYPGKKVVATGYWLFKINELHTCSRLLGGTGVVHEEMSVSRIPLRKRIENSMRFRREEFGTGYLEILEECEVDGTSYYSGIEQNDLLPLPVSGKKNPKKFSPYSSGTSTTHEVLKERLK